MKAKPTISIPKPCSQSWSDMQPHYQGRFCGSCQKSVINFSAMSNAEILDILSSSNKVCGRFTIMQLHTLNSQATVIKPSPWWKRFSIAATIISFLSVLRSEAKTIAPKPIMYQDSVYKKGEIKAAGVTISKQITGRVTDQNNEPIIGATVKVKGSNVATITKTNGDFVITVPVKNKVFLIVSFIGYRTAEVKVRPGESRKIDFKLQMESTMLGEVTVVY